VDFSFVLLFGMSWADSISDFDVPALQRAFPLLKRATAYAWKSGERSPPEYAQADLLAGLKARSQTRPNKQDAGNGSKVARRIKKA